MDKIKIISENEFISKLLDLQYIDFKDNNFDNLISEMKHLSRDGNWAKGGPEDDVSFWNAEAFMWCNKISANKRKQIQEELLALLLIDKVNINLDLGAGGFSYIPSIAFDFSKKMLSYNDNAIKKIEGDLGEKLPFEDNYFDSITAIFVFNYVKNLNLILKEIKRVLKKDGICIIVQNAKKINDWQRQKEKNEFNENNTSSWFNFFTSFGFEVNLTLKNNLLFFKLKNNSNHY